MIQQSKLLENTESMLESTESMLKSTERMAFLAMLPFADPYTPIKAPNKTCTRPLLVAGL